MLQVDVQAVFAEVVTFLERINRESMQILVRKFKRGRSLGLSASQKHNRPMYVCPYIRDYSCVMNSVTLVLLIELGGIINSHLHPSGCLCKNARGCVI